MKGLGVAAVAGIFCVVVLLSSNVLRAQQQPKRTEISEAGSATLKFEKSKTARTAVALQSTYSKPPLVILSECGSAGGWILIKSENITTKRFEIVGIESKHDATTYIAEVAYVVIARD